MLSRAVCAALVLAAVTGLAGCGPGQLNRDEMTWSFDEVLQTGWTTAELDQWRQEIDLAGQPPNYSQVGAYPIGNGRVFGIIGLTVPLGTIGDCLGPTYQKLSGLMGSYMPVVLVGGKPVMPASQSTAWVSPGGVVHSTWEDTEGLRVDLLAAVPPDVDAFVQLIMVSNNGRRTIGDLALGITCSLPSPEEVEGDLVGQRGPGRVRMGFAGARTDVVELDATAGLPGGLSDRLMPLGVAANRTEPTRLVRCRLGSLPSGQSVGKIARITMCDTEEAEAEAIAAINQQGLGLIEATHTWWQKWADETLTFEGLPDALGQFLTIGKYICRVQQAEAGGYSPMHKYTYRWIRDANGPILHLLDAGDFESVARDLHYHFTGCASVGDVGNNLPLNLSVDQAPAVDWTRVPTPKAEIASFVILQNYWYWMHTGQTEQLEQRWGYLKACLDGQAVDDEGRLPFHGDETYRFPGYNLYESGDAEAVPDYVNLHLRSADSAFEYVAAALAMAKMAEAIGKGDEAPACREAARKVRQATERYYWQSERGYYAPAMSELSGELYRYPFANINMRPLWIGYAEPGDRHQRDNVLGALKWLFRPESRTTKLTPACGYTVGMTPGMVLWALADINHPAALDALEGLLASAEPAGGFAEMNRPDDTPSRDVWGLHRIRPWEGGINCSAVLKLLTGFTPNAPERKVSFAPHLPPDCSDMTVRRLRIADALLTLHLAREGEQVTCTVTCEQATEPIEVQITLVALGAPEYRAARESRSIGGSGQPQQVSVSAPAAQFDEQGESLEVAGEPFDYGPATIERGAALLLTWSADVVEQVRADQPEVRVMDTRISWPAAYLRSALLSDSGRPRFERLITDTEGYPGAFKPKDYWTAGEGAEVLRDYRNAGGRVEACTAPAAGKEPSAELIN
ncbi:MAG TPA: hypothetical protein VM283_02010 [Armatimonadota bacterium]|nr:hypothetical protein [Armatimonadota bacterium]